MKTREEAFALLRQHNRDESHIQHALAVEAAMRYFAGLYGGDPELWGLSGLLHDLDWEECPEEHPRRGAQWLREEGYPEELVRAVLAHGWGLAEVTEEPLSDMEKVLYAIDELTGFVTAVTLVRPSRSLDDLEVKSVKKKMKDKSFARGVNREIISKGADMLGKPLDWLIEQVIVALRPIQKSIGLEEGISQ